MVPIPQLLLRLAAVVLLTVVVGTLADAGPVVQPVAATNTSAGGCDLEHCQVDAATTCPGGCGQLHRVTGLPALDDDVTRLQLSDTGRSFDAHDRPSAAGTVQLHFRPPRLA